MAIDKIDNPLISTQKSSDSGLQVALHPLVLLTISDYITRHTLRLQKTPIVGALIGQQNGREITIEHAFECLVIEEDDKVLLHSAWFEDRLQQMKDVHKAPALELVGWYTTLPYSGPQPFHLPIHRQILESYNESAMLLGFHPAQILDSSEGGKLPLTIYESNYEAEETPTEAGEDQEMKDIEPKLALKFKELPFSIETGEAEMISVDFVARGGGNATAVDGTIKKQTPAAEPTGKGKQAAKETLEKESEVPSKSAKPILSRGDEELIASLTAKANAIKMLHARINLIAAYLREVQSSEGVESNTRSSIPSNHSILRSIQGLLTRLSLLVPADSKAFEQELLSEQNDVSLVSMLSSMTESIKDIRETGRKYHIVEMGKQSKERAPQNRHPWGNGSGNGMSSAGDLHV